jgi:hypothetical protein
MDATGLETALNAMARGYAAGLLASLVLVGCATAEQKKAAENAAIQKRAATEIERICALPEAQREAEIQKIKDQSGMVLYCGNK